MDAAIADFLKCLEAEEQELYAGLHGALSHLPVPGKVDLKELSVHTAVGAGMLPHMDDRRCGTSHPQMCCCICMLRTTCLIMFCLTVGYAQYKHGISV